MNTKLTYFHRKTLHFKLALKTRLKLTRHLTFNESDTLNDVGFSFISFSLACRSTGHPSVICEKSSVTTKLSSVLSLRLCSCKYIYLTDALYLVSGFNVISSIFFHPNARCSSLDILFILRLGHLWLQ